MTKYRTLFASLICLFVLTSHSQSKMGKNRLKTRASNGDNDDGGGGVVTSRANI